MSNKKSNVSFDQIPHIILNHPDTNSQHWAIMIRLYKILKDKPYCIYSNKKLSTDIKLSLRTTERRISELIKMGFLACIGQSYNRRLSLGLLFNTSAKITVKSLNTPAKNVEHLRHSGGYTNNYTNNKERKISYDPNYQEYVGQLKADIQLGLKPKDTKILSYEEYRLVISS